MSDVVQEGQGMPIFFPCWLERNWLLKSWVHDCCWVLVTTAVGGVCPVRKKCFPGKVSVSSVWGVRRDCSDLLFPAVLSWKQGHSCQSSSASTRLIPAALTGQRGEKINKSHLILVCFLVLLRGHLAARTWAQCPACIREMHFFGLCFYKAKYSIVIKGEVNKSGTVACSFISARNKKESKTFG